MDRQADRWIDRQGQRQTDRQDGWTDRQTDGRSDRQTDRQDRWRNRETDKWVDETNWQRERQNRVSNVTLALRHKVLFVYSASSVLRLRPLTSWTWCWPEAGTRVTRPPDRSASCTSQTESSGWTAGSTQPGSTSCWSTTPTHTHTHTHTHSEGGRVRVREWERARERERDGFFLS